jgi:hypothetical protein
MMQVLARHRPVDRITDRYPIFRRGINSSGQTAPVTLGYLRESRYPGTVYREGRADQWF